MMAEITLLNEAELRQAIKLDRGTVDCIEDAFRKLATEPVVMPPILRLDFEDKHGEVDVKTAYVPGLPGFAIKMSPGFFDNPSKGLPSLNGLMVLFSTDTGVVQAVLFDNGYLTDVRTAAAGGVAARWLAPADARTAGIVGAGAQARLQLEALTLVRELDEALVYARDPSKARAFAAEMSQSLGLPVRPVDRVEALVHASEVVVTTTPSTTPLIEADWLHAGLHITAMGSDAEHKNELAPAVLARADCYVCDRRSQALTLGELHHAVAAGVVAEDMNPPELGEVIAGRRQGRTSPGQISIADLTGTGVQDTAIATLAFQRALAAGAGTPFRS
jgi:ornithine cyclodeaminase